MKLLLLAVFYQVFYIWLHIIVIPEYQDEAYMENPDWPSQIWLSGHVKNASIKAGWEQCIKKNKYKIRNNI